MRLHPANKLHRYSPAPIAWGCSGNSQISKELSDWIEQLSLPTGWPVLQDKIRKLSELNSHQREMSTSYGTQSIDFPRFMS
jgi:hypothetical protein